MEYSRQVLWHRSSLTEAAQPLVASVPAEANAATTAAAVVVLLHDTLPEPTVGCFVEGAFVQADAWLSHQKLGAPSILLQPFGFGNAGWIGPGTVQIADAVRHVRAATGATANELSLIGFGAGATGALQLAGLHPDMFAAVAAIDPWTDAALDPGDRLVEPPVWETWPRAALCPIELAANFARIRVWLESTAQATGLAGSARAEHAERMASALKRAKIEFRRVEQPIISFGEPGRMPRDPAAVWRFLTAPTLRCRGAVTRFVATLPRFAVGNDIAIAARRVGRIAAVTVDCQASETSVRTEGVDAFEWVGGSAGEAAPPIVVDRGTAFGGGNADAATIRFERVANRWTARGVSACKVDFLSCLCPDATAAGPMLELFFRRPTIVPGSLGDDRENLVLRQLAEAIAQAVASGVDSPNLHPANRETSLVWPIVLDAALADSDLDERDFVLLGTARSNLLIAKLAGSLPFRWQFTEADDAPAGVAIDYGHGRLAGDRQALAALAPIAPGSRRLALVMTATTLDGYIDLARLKLAFCSRYIALSAGKVADWGDDPLEFAKSPRLRSQRGKPAKSKRAKQ